MKISPFVAGFIVLAAACNHRPEEASGSDAGSAGSVASAASPTTSAPARVDSPDAGHGPNEQLCDDVYGADLARMHDRCSSADLNLSQTMARMASKLCAHDLQVGIERSRATVDRDAAGKCTEMLREKALAQTSEVDTVFGHFPCDRILVGTQAEGQACLFSIECKDGLACVGYKIGEDGKCQKPPKAKEACTGQAFGTVINDAAAVLHHPACAKGAFCDGTTCQPRVAAGKACDRSDSCAEGLACVQSKCGTRGAAASACTVATDCAFGLWCDRGADAGSGKCAGKGLDGQSCSSEDACKGRCDMPKGKDGKPHPPGKCAAVCGSG
jgi:hypothetical protein